MLEIHGIPGSRSSRFQWLCEELGVPYELVKLDFMKGEHKGDPHLSRHAHGLVPAIELADGPMIESAAMCMMLADEHPEKKFAPAPGSPARARYYEAIVYAVSTIDDCVIPMYFHKKLLPEDKRDPKVVAAKEPTWKTIAAVLTARLGDKPYLCGAEISAADIVVGYDLMLAMQIGLLADSPKLAAYTERLISRPAWKRTFGG